MLNQLNESLTQKEFKTLIKKARFGLELECVRNADFSPIERVTSGYSDYNRLEDLLDRVSNLTKIRNLKTRLSEATSLTEAKVNEIIEAAVTIRTIFYEYQHQPHYGGYGTGRSSNGWRIESDGSLPNGVEIVTPLNRGEAVDYDYMMKSIPKLASALRVIGLVGSDSYTGTHIHVSHGNDVNYNSYLRLKNWFSSHNYTSFAFACFISSQESDFYMKQGNYERRWKHYSKSFQARLEESFSSNIGSVMLGTIYEEFMNKYPNIDLDATNVKYVLKIPSYSFCTTQSRTKAPKGFQKFIKDHSDNYLSNVSSGSHYVDMSARRHTIEFRGLGGEKAVQSIQNQAALGRILRTALVQANSFIKNPDTIEFREVQKKVSLMLKEVFQPILFEKLNSRNIIGYNTNSLSEDAKKFFKNFKCAGIEIDDSIRKIEVLVVDSVEITPKTTGQGLPGTYRASKAVKLNYKVTTKRLPTRTEVTVDTTQVSTDQIQVIVDTNSNLTSQERRDTVQPSTENVTNVSSNETMIVIGYHTFIAEYMVRPSLRSRSFTFEYGDEFRYIYQFSTVELARDVFTRVTRVVAAAARGASLNPNLTYRRVEHLNSMTTARLNRRERDARLPARTST